MFLLTIVAGAAMFRTHTGPCRLVLLPIFQIPTHATILLFPDPQPDPAPTTSYGDPPPTSPVRRPRPGDAADIPELAACRATSSRPRALCTKPILALPRRVTKVAAPPPAVSALHSTSYTDARFLLGGLKWERRIRTPATPDFHGRSRAPPTLPSPAAAISSGLFSLLVSELYVRPCGD